MKALSVALKDIQIFYRDRNALLVLFVLPLVFIVVFSGALAELGKERTSEEEAARLPKTRVALPVADLDGGAAAKTLLDGLDAAGGVRVERRDQAQAMAALDENKIERVLIVPTGFTADIEQGRPTTLRLVNHPDADPEQTEAVRLVVEGVASDMSLQIQLLASLRQMGEMQANAPEAYQKAFSAERLQAQARSQFEAARTQPLVAVKQRVPTAPEGTEKRQEPISWASLIVPGCAVLFVFLTAQATASSIYDEKKAGAFRRLLAAPISKASLLLGKLLPNFIIALIQMAVIFAFGTVGLRLLGLSPISLGNDPLALILVVALVALCSSALGIVIAAIGRTESQISGLSTLLLWVMGILGGSLVPLFILESFLGPLPMVVPHYWANRALDNLMLRGLGLAGVTTELAVLLGFTAFFFAIGLWRFDYD